MQLFYIELSTNDDRLILTEDDHRHCVKVLRKRIGDELILTDGRGQRILASITNISKKQTELAILRKTEEEKRNWNLSIAIAPTKNLSRFEWFLEKATEIGIDHIYPIICTHSERKTLKIERCRKILISAMKQSGQFFLPHIHEIQSFENSIRLKSNENKYIAYVEENFKRLNKIYNSKKDVIIYIGPEGGFSKDEIMMASKEGVSQVSLGTTRLRTETAGVVATQIINGINYGD